MTGLREALGEKRPAPRSEFDNGWNDCRDFVLRLMAERAPREGRGHRVELTLPLRGIDLSGAENNNCGGFEDGWNAALDAVDARLEATRD